MKTGLQCTSLPLRFSVHAMSSSLVRTVASAPLSFRTALILEILLSADSPAKSRGCMVTLSSGSSGLSSQIMSNGSEVATALRLDGMKSHDVQHHPSKPTLLPGFSSFARYSAMVGVESSPAFISLMPVPSSCCSACMKYRESVQTAALLFVMTNVPAEPVKPEIHFLASQCCGTYSPSCGSVLGTTKASISFFFIHERKASSLLFINSMLQNR